LESLGARFSAREIQDLLQHIEFSQIPYQFHQLCCFDDDIKKFLTNPLDAKELATLFELNECTVRKNLLRDSKQPGSLGRHTALNPEVESSLVPMLLDAFHEEKAMRQKEFLKIDRKQQNSKLTTE
jgi:hypothetical protein